MYSASQLYRGEQATAGFTIGDAMLDLTRSPMLSPKSSSNLTAVSSSTLHLQFGGLIHANMASLDMAGSTVGGVGAGNMSFSRAQLVDNWGDSGMVASSPRTDTSTDVDNDDKNTMSAGAHNGTLVCVDSIKGKAGDQKTLRRLAQNREAARKSRMRKKVYVQQLENSRVKLMQLEQDLQRARQQGIFVATSLPGDHNYPVSANGALAFDMDYARWLDEHQRQINELRSALNSHVGEDELRLHVATVMIHYDEIFRLKSIGTKSDVFHLLSGMWTTPAERCFMWLGGFRSSDLLKIIASQLEPLTDQQLVGICNLQQSSQQAEDALTQGMEALQQSLAETLVSARPSAGSDNVANYMDQMAIAMSKLVTLENFVRQADLLRQQTLHQMHRILTARQAARAFLAISDYFSRLRALSSLWFARPRD